MSITKIGNSVQGFWSVYLTLTIDTDYSATQVKVTATLGLYFRKKYKHYYSDDNCGVEGEFYWYTSKSGSATQNAGTYVPYGTVTKYINKKKSSFTATLEGWIAHSQAADHDGWVVDGTSTTSYSFTVPAITNYAVSYNANKPAEASGTVANVPASQTKYYGTNLTLSSTRPTLTNYTFTGWNTKADGTGTSYTPGATYSGNAALTLYAQWSANNPPTIGTFDDPEIGGVVSVSGNPIKGFSTVNIAFDGAAWDSGRSLTSIILTCGQDTVTLTASDLTDGAGVFSFVPSESGTYPVTVTIKDSANISLTYTLENITIENPTWTKDCTFTTEAPAKATSGTPMLITAEVYNYRTSSWDTVAVTTELTTSDGEWSFPYTFDEDHVSDPTSASPTTQIRVAYTHYDVQETETRKAFFNTSRNQNYSNGIYNVMFVGGIESGVNPNLTSRLWWSAINNPLYFPDTNYVEVGSNDTAVQGLTKVGDYLGVIKQSKTTDTAIYLLYPTSFEENTTYAVKQGVQGVGALSKYCFNVLGDETLFLSPNGIMAIAMSEDNDHRVQNRSYFVDGKLLKEAGLINAYSFVYESKYWLSVGGRCYVLDGNQRNSWGNDRTNLVYECYYLENIPAACFAKFNDRLIFSTAEEVCRFKTEQSGNAYCDAFESGSEIVSVYTPQDVSPEAFAEDPTAYFYIGSDGEYVRCTAHSTYDAGTQYYTRTSQHETVDVPVRAEWSTILDDDGYVNFYKNMQKKGSMVSILPTGYKYVVAEIDAAMFAKSPGSYFTFDGSEYNRCSAQDSFDSTETYYVRGASETKVFVRKDNEAPVEIERSFNEASDIPSELFIRKKFKKYKRLQIIVRNDVAEPFGVDEIIKTYSVGNYAKK